MKVISKIMTGLTHVLEFLAGVMILFSTLLSTIGVFCRYVLKAPIVWSTELCLFAVIGMVYLAMPVLEYQNDQLTISAILKWVKGEKGRKILVFIRGIITIITSAVISYYGFVIAFRSISRNILTPTLRFNKGYFYLLVAICFAISVLVWLVIFLRKGEYEDGHAS